jgi:NitT/TauT family transport system substrate-binding protein
MKKIILFLLLVSTFMPFVQGAEAKKLRLGHFPNLTHTQAIYARATGDFEKSIGVPIEWKSFNAGPSAIESLFAGAIDATYIGPTPTINGYVKSEGQALRIIAGATVGGAALVVRSDAGISSDKDFNNKIIATPQLGNTQDIAARLWFQEKGYTLKEKGGNLTVLPIANPDQLVLFQKKEIAGAWTIEPWVSRLEAEAGGKIFLEEKSLWPEGKYTTTHLIVSKKFLDKNRDLVKKLIAAHVEVTQKLIPSKEVETILGKELKRETGKELPNAIIHSALGRLTFTWDPVVTSLKKNALDAHKTKFLRSVPDLSAIYDLTLLSEVLIEKGLPPVR